LDLAVHTNKRYSRLGGGPPPPSGHTSPKLQLLSGHAKEKSLALYRDLALADVSPEHQEAMRALPIR